MLRSHGQELVSSCRGAQCSRPGEKEKKLETPLREPPNRRGPPLPSPEPCRERGSHLPAAPTLTGETRSLWEQARRAGRRRRAGWGPRRQEGAPEVRGLGRARSAGEATAGVGGSGSRPALAKSEREAQAELPCVLNAGPRTGHSCGGIPAALDTPWCPAQDSSEWWARGALCAPWWGTPWSCRAA